MNFKFLNFCEDLFLKSIIDSKMDEFCANKLLNDRLLNFTNGIIFVDSMVNADVLSDLTEMVDNFYDNVKLIYVYPKSTSPFTHENLLNYSKNYFKIHIESLTDLMNNFIDIQKGLTKGIDHFPAEKNIRPYSVFRDNTIEMEFSA